MGRTVKPAALVGLAALFNGVRAQTDLDVDNPGEVVLDKTFTLTWNSVGQNKFDVMLFPNSASCDGSEPVDLCNESDGCGDSKGDLNIVVPMAVGAGEREYPYDNARFSSLEYVGVWFERAASSVN